MTTAVNVSLANGRQVQFDIDQSGVGPACFALGIRKCGSTLLTRLCRILAEQNGRNVTNVGKFFQENVPEDVWTNDPAVTQLLHPGNFYNGFRMMPVTLADHPIFREGRKILLVRDPRDALVSEYFSMRFSHPIPARLEGASPATDMLEKSRREARNEEIDDFVIRRAALMQHAFLGYGDVARASSTVWVKYEDYIFRKPELIRLIEAHFAWTVNSNQIDRIMAVVDRMPEIEDPAAFVRQVAPGDHRRKLRSETIKRLDSILTPCMEMFGYLGE